MLVLEFVLVLGVVFFYYLFFIKELTIDLLLECVIGVYYCPS